MFVVVGHEIAKSKAVAAAYIVHISVSGGNLQEFIEELLHHIIIALYKTPDQIGKQPAAVKEILRGDRPGFGIVGIHSPDRIEVKGRMEKPYIGKQRIAGERPYIGCCAHEPETVDIIVSDIKARDLRLGLGSQRRGKIQLHIDRNSRIVELLHHIRELLLRTALIPRRAVRCARRIIKSSSVTPVINFLYREIPDGTPVVIDGIKRQRVLHRAGTGLGPGDRLKFIDGHQFDCRHT